MSEDCNRIICEQMEFKFHEAGDLVFRYGDYGDLFYIILQGEVEVLIPSDSQKKKLHKSKEKAQNKKKKTKEMEL